MWINHLKRQYNLTFNQYNQMIKQQNNKCLICGSKPGKKALHVDHNHKTKKVRGLLCYNCNMTLGFVHENKIILMKLVNYIDIYK